MIFDPHSKHIPAAGGFQEEQKIIDKTARTFGLPAGVAKGAIHDLARIPDENHKKLSISQVADKWGIAEAKAREMDAALKGDYSKLRATGASKCLILASLMSHDLLERLQDPEQLAKVPTEKMPKMIKEACDAAVLLQDGHQPSVNMDLGSLVQGAKAVQETMAKAKEVITKGKKK